MSYQEKRSLVYIFNFLLIAALYYWYVFVLHAEESVSTEDFRIWGRVVLFMIPVQIVITIVTQIIFAILNTIATREDIPEITDERDKLIEMKATRNAYYLLMGGIVLSMIPVVMGSPLYIMFNLLICFFMGASFVWSLSQFLYYRRGY